MKVGILTFHYAHNYGAVLQAYALKTYLRSQGHEVVILNYQNTTIASRYQLKRPYEYHLKDIRHVRRLRTIAKSVLDRRASEEHWKRQFYAFEAFIDKYLLDSKKDILDIRALESVNLDVLIAGSDQIWNHGLTGGIDSVYYLDFKTNAKKMFYAASNGKDSIPDKDASYCLGAIQNADYISTREGGLANYLSSALSRKVYHAVDPSLLLDEMQYDFLAGRSEAKEPYIFAYFVAENDTMSDIVRYVSRALKLKVIELHYYRTRKISGPDQRADMGPIEFLQSIKNAELIFTNSFHGTVFSIIFQKKFYSVFKKDARIENLLEGLNLGERHINSAKEIDLNSTIDYKAVNMKLKQIRADSVEFLNVLGEQNN